MESNTTTNSSENKPLQKTPEITLESTVSKISKIASKPPSPMPIQSASSQPDSEIESVEFDSSRFAHYRDYNGQSFDARIHAVKTDGTPQLTKGGKLKLLPPSKRNLVENITDSVKRVFSKPPTEEELTEQEEETARAQAEAASSRDRLEVSAKRATDSYFAAGSLLGGSGFLKNYKDRNPQIHAIMLEYEMATGRTFELPPWLALTIGLSTDMITQFSTVEECSLANGVVGRAQSAFKERAKQAGREHVESKLAFLNPLNWFSKKEEPMKTDDPNESENLELKEK